MENRCSFILNACREISIRVGHIIDASSIYEVPAWGFQSDVAFLNCIVVLESTTHPMDAMTCFQKIELDLGRKRGMDSYASRTIDIDILFFGNLVMSHQQLTIPHPLMHLRSFCIAPMCEIKPDLKHPVFEKTMCELAEFSAEQMKLPIFLSRKDFYNNLRDYDVFI